MPKKSESQTKKIGVILMTYGSPKTEDEVEDYLQRIHRKKVSSQLLEEFKRRYQVIGGSPLITITQNQARALEKELNSASSGQTVRFIVEAGMRFSPPFISEIVSRIANQTNLIVGLIMSPQYSPIIMQGYEKELREAAESIGTNKLNIIMATDWHKEPLFITSLAKKVTEQINSLPQPIKKGEYKVLFSAHSMPKKVIDKEPGYINSLQETAELAALKAGLAESDWAFCYQSAGHTPEEWLKPDFADMMPVFAKKGVKHVIIAPVQFLADHLEILYDVEIGAREQAENAGIVFHRINSLNTDEDFIKSLSSTVHSLL